MAMNVLACPAIHGRRFVMVFQNPQRRISKASKTTYAGWCENNNFELQAVK